MTLRDTQREIRKNDFLKGAVSSRTAFTYKPKGFRGSAGAVVGAHPKTAATTGALTLVALGAGGKTIYDARDGKYSPKKKVKKSWEKDDTASVAIGGGAGAAVMPIKAPKARGQRKHDLNAMWDRASGAAKEGTADIKITPTELGRTAEQKGSRAFNSGYTASSAKWNGFPEDKKYEIDMFKDNKGNVRLQQINGRHFAETRNMQDKDIPTRVRMVDGAPREEAAWKTITREVKSRKQRRTLRDERGLHPDIVNRRAGVYESRFGAVARAANEKSHSFLRDEAPPIKTARKNLRSKQAAYIAGGAGALYGANKLVRRKSDKGPTNAITGTSQKYSDIARDKMAAAIDPNRKMIEKKDKDRYGAAAGGAVAGAAVMPVRESAGGPGKKVAQRLKDMPEGMQDVKTSDIMDVAAPGVRRGNKDYTTRMAADIAGVTDKPWDPEPGRIQITDDGARVTGGQHRAVARGWAGQPTQRMEIVRTPGKMGATSPGVVAATKQIKRRLAPIWYKRNTPKSKEDLIARNAKASEKKIAHAKGHSTPSKAALDPVLDSKGLRRLHGKQAAIMAGGAGVAVGANELRRNYVSKGARMQAFKVGAKNFHPIRARTDRRIAETSRLAGANFTQGVADSVKANMPKVDVPNVEGMGESVKRGGQALGAGAATGGLLSGAGKVIGDAVQASATKAAAKESTKRAKIYAGAGVGSAGLLGTGIAFRRKRD
jgi:hypothetical protein